MFYFYFSDGLIWMQLQSNHAIFQVVLKANQMQYSCFMHFCDSAILLMLKWDLILSSNLTEQRKPEWSSGRMAHGNVWLPSPIDIATSLEANVSACSCNVTESTKYNIIRSLFVSMFFYTNTWRNSRASASLLRYLYIVR